MRGFMSSFSPILRAYKIEAALLGLAFVTTVASAGVFYASASPVTSANEITFSKKDRPDSMIYVDIAGAVVKPGLYRLAQGSRLADLLRASGGLAPGVDRAYFERTFNLAHLMTDQEKVYIPLEGGVTLGTETMGSTVSHTTSSGININTATAVQLDTLPGVGPVTSNKIIDGRPYSSLDELVSKKIISKSVFEKIKELISIN